MTLLILASESHLRRTVMLLFEALKVLFAEVLVSRYTNRFLCVSQFLLRFKGWQRILRSSGFTNCD